MKNKNYDTVGKLTKSVRKIVERGKIDTQQHTNIWLRTSRA